MAKVKISQVERDVERYASFILGVGVVLIVAGMFTSPVRSAMTAPRDAICPLPADLDGSGLVDLADISLVARRWHLPVDGPRFDLDDDGDTDVVDVMLVAADRGADGPTAPRLPGGGVAWAEGSTRKVRPTDPAPANTWVWDGCRVRLHAARGETEPVQLVIRAGTQDLTGVNVAVSDLTNGAGAPLAPSRSPELVEGEANTISPAQITLYRAAYHAVSQSSDPYGYGLPAGTLEPGRIPDALIPFGDAYNPGEPVGVPFDVAAGQNQPIWIDLAVPDGASPGAYAGWVTVTSDQGSLSVPLTLVVWDFSLPSQPSLSVNFTLDPAWTLPPQYGVSEGTSDFYDLIDKHYAALVAHRLGPMNLYRAPTVDESGGQIRLDWTGTEALYQRWLDTYDLPAFYIPDVYDAYNEQYRISDASGTPYAEADFNDSVFVNRAKQYYTAMRDDLMARGWWDQAWTYLTDETEWVADEPLNNGLDGYQRLEAWAQLLKDTDPDYRIMASSVYPVPVGPPDRGWPDLKGLVDDWNVVVQDADLNPELWESRQALGESLSFYHNDWGDFLDYKATLHRGLGWVAYKYGAWAVTGWAAMAWIGNADTGEIVNPWTSSVDPLFGYGGGALFWPGKTIEGDGGKNVDGPLPSVRLKLAREAVEDHDYLALLALQTSPDYARALVRGLIPRDYWDWDPSPVEIYRLRDRIGRLLDSGASISLATVQGRVTDAATGRPIEGAFVTDGASGALTDVGGRYTLTIAVPAGSAVTLNFSAPRYLQTSEVFRDFGSLHADATLIRVPEESLLLYSFETEDEWSDEWEFANTTSVGRVTDHATHGSYALEVAFNDNTFFLARWLNQWPAAGVGTFPTQDWSSYTALEFDVHNASDYYTYMEVGVGDAGEGWYPSTGGTITLLPKRAHHVVIPLADIAASGVDLTRIEWLEIAPETIITDDNGDPRWPAGPRTLYFDNLRLVRVETD